MNVTRIAILGVAAMAAGAAALMVRGMLGGGTATVEASAPPPAITTDVLVAAKTVAPGRVLDANSVQWVAWPKSSVSGTFITRDAQPDTTKAVAGLVVRSPLVVGQPITESNTVHTDAKGFMAATVMPGMRAVAMPITADSAAGGFLLPNDRVDVILTHDVSGGQGPKNFQADTILRDVRLLAIDQTAQQTDDTQSQVGKTATIEISPGQAELVEQARASGTLSLTLRSLGDSTDQTLASEPAWRRTNTGSIAVIRYGVVRSANAIAAGNQAGGDQK